MKATVLALFMVALLFASDIFKEALSYYYDEDSSTNAKAITLLEQVAKEGSVDAAFLLGVAYDRGGIAKEDKAKALKWYIQAAHLGDVDAMVLSGWFYYKGEGCKKDLKKAYMWFEKAHNLGDAEAKEMMDLIEQQNARFF